MTDFEVNLREAINKLYPDSELLGCYFHYIKNLYSKLKKISLTNKKTIKEALKFLFFKIYPYLKDENKNDYIKNIINYYLTKENENAIKYYEFIKYFLKNWYGQKITSFETLSDEY